ncbi:MAG: hypothetical protein ACLPUO_01295 [Streptosporangiaceae bacterium]|jgi:hypothetical protein
MADDRTSTPGDPSGWMRDFLAQLRWVTERMEGLTDLGRAVPSVPSLASQAGWPAPGALSAAQLNSIAASVAAQRRSVDALKTQLSAFDEQLAVFEQIIEPLAEWTRTWADFEARMLNTRRETGGPAAGDQAAGS